MVKSWLVLPGPKATPLTSAVIPIRLPAIDQVVPTFQTVTRPLCEPAITSVLSLETSRTANPPLVSSSCPSAARSAPSQVQIFTRLSVPAEYRSLPSGEKATSVISTSVFGSPLTQAAVVLELWTYSVQ